MRIWMNENDRQRIYIDVGDGNEVVDFMVRNSIFVESAEGNVLTYNTAQFSLGMTARNLKAMVEFYKCRGWEVTADVQAITDDFVKRAEEERERREEEQLRLWMEERERQKKLALRTSYTLYTWNYCKKKNATIGKKRGDILRLTILWN